MEKYTKNSPEPQSKKSSCAYCGDAPIIHALFYFDSLVSSVIEPHVSKVAKASPQFLKTFADWLPIFTFKTFSLFGLAKFSADLSKVKTFRSRVVWEEALRRGIKMEQLILFGKPMEFYRAFLNGKEIYFQSLPIPPKYLELTADWDNKFVLKEELKKHGIPVPAYIPLSNLNEDSLAQTFDTIPKPFIVKPKLGSRGRHTTTNIHTLPQMKEAVRIAKILSPHLIIEEHLTGYVCRATLVSGKLAGFYRGEAPTVVGDGTQTIKQLISEKDRNRNARVEAVTISEELKSHIGRSGFALNDVLPKGVVLPLTHRVGRLFGGATKEMLDELHPNFIPIFEKVAKLTELAVAGIDCIIPDPTKAPDAQKWGIIECNTLPFIDLHYYALEGKPQNIAGMIWDFWK
ncbi:MAG: hypothetical protein WCT29_02075 [Candidatus Paceibacterota bacterium]|jgi:D-alanine-D-alanine ligase-like ATP-grasp enzyme